MDLNKLKQHALRGDIRQSEILDLIALVERQGNVLEAAGITLESMPNGSTNWRQEAELRARAVPVELPRYDLVETQHGLSYNVYWDKAMEVEEDGEWVKYEDVRCALSQSPPVAQAAVPDGWKLVPIAPTSEMIEAGARHGVDGDFDNDLSNGVKELSRSLAAGSFKDMLAAAPQAPQPQAVDEARDAARWQAFRARDEFDNLDFDVFQEQFREDADRIVDAAMAAREAK